MHSAYAYTHPTALLCLKAYRTMPCTQAKKNSAASHSVSPATSSQGPVWIIWSVIAAHKWATPHEWKCSKASAAMITVCSQVIAPSPSPSLALLPSPRLLLLLNERIKVARVRQRAFAKKGEGARYRQSIITCNETFVLEHYRDVLEVTP